MRPRSPHACHPTVRLLRLALPLLALVALLAAIPGAASVRVSDRSIHADVFQRVYDQMPDAWKLPETVLIREVSDREMNALASRDSDGDADHSGSSGWEIEGFYESSDDASEPASITLRRSLRPEETAFVFAHEYGHFLWDALLSDSQRHQYSRLWAARRREGRLVTRYAAESDEEGFAEAIACYLRKPSLLRRRDPSSWRFVQTISQAIDESEPDI